MPGGMIPALVVAVILIAGVAAIAVDAGPPHLFVLVQRFGPLAILGVPCALVLSAAVGWWVGAGGVLAAWWLAGVATLVRAWWVLSLPVDAKSLWTRGWRRCRWRWAWPSIARAAGLATRESRPANPWGDTSTKHLSEIKVEWLPTLTRGRAIEGGHAVQYRVRPARGSTIAQVAEMREALAAAGHAYSVEVLPIAPDRGELVVVFGDVLAEVS